MTPFDILGRRQPPRQTPINANPLRGLGNPLDVLDAPPPAPAPPVDPFAAGSRRQPPAPVDYDRPMDWAAFDRELGSVSSRLAGLRNPSDLTDAEQDAATRLGERRTTSDLAAVEANRPQFMRDVAPTALRVGLPLAAGFASGGMLAPLALASLGAEGLAQATETAAGAPIPTPMEQVGGAAGTTIGNVVPGNILQRIPGAKTALGSAARGLGIGAAEGAAGGATEVMLRNLIGKGELPEQDELAATTGLSSGMGGALGALLGLATGGRAPAAAGAPFQTAGKRVSMRPPLPDLPDPGQAPATGMTAAPRPRNPLDDIIDAEVLSDQPYRPLPSAEPAGLLPPGPAAAPQLPPPSTFIPPPPEGFEPPAPRAFGPGRMAEPTSADVLSPEYLARVEGTPRPPAPPVGPDADLNRMLFGELAAPTTDVALTPRPAAPPPPGPRQAPGGLVSLKKPENVGGIPVVAVDWTNPDTTILIDRAGKRTEYPSAIARQIFPDIAPPLETPAGSAGPTSQNELSFTPRQPRQAPPEAPQAPPVAEAPPQRLADDEDALTARALEGDPAAIAEVRARRAEAAPADTTPDVDPAPPAAPSRPAPPWQRPGQVGPPVSRLPRRAEPDADIERLLRQADEQDAAADAARQRQEPTVEVLDEADIQNNASGESSASVEAMNRQASMRAKGEQFVMVDRAGNVQPLIGPDAVDIQPRPGQTKGILRADGTFERVLGDGPNPKPSEAERLASNTARDRAVEDTLASRDRAPQDFTPPPTRQTSFAEADAPPPPVADAPPPVADSPSVNENRPVRGHRNRPPNTEEGDWRPVGDDAEVQRTKFTAKDGVEKDAVEVRFSEAPDAATRAALKEAGFTYRGPSRKWTYNVPATPRDDVRFNTVADAESFVDGLLGKTPPPDAPPPTARRPIARSVDEEIDGLVGTKKKAPTPDPTDPTAPRDVLGHNQAQARDGVTLGDRLTVSGKTGVVKRIFEIPAKKGKPATWRAEMAFEADGGYVQNVDLADLPRAKATDAPTAKAAPEAPRAKAPEPEAPKAEAPAKGGPDDGVVIPDAVVREDADGRFFVDRTGFPASVDTGPAGIGRDVATDIARTLGEAKLANVWPGQTVKLHGLDSGRTAKVAALNWDAKAQRMDAVLDFGPRNQRSGETVPLRHLLPDDSKVKYAGALHAARMERDVPAARQTPPEGDPPTPEELKALGRGLKNTEMYSPTVFNGGDSRLMHPRPAENIAGLMVHRSGYTKAFTITHRGTGLSVGTAPSAAQARKIAQALEKHGMTAALGDITSPASASKAVRPIMDKAAEAGDIIRTPSGAHSLEAPVAPKDVDAAKPKVTKRRATPAKDREIIGADEIAAVQAEATAKPEATIKAEADAAMKNRPTDEDGDGGIGGGGGVVLGSGLGGLQDLYEKNPYLFWQTIRTVGGGLLGAATADEDDNSRIDNFIMGAAIGSLSGPAARVMRRQAPKVFSALKDLAPVRPAKGAPKALPAVRRARAKNEDIGIADLFLWSPNKVVPDVWKKVRPVLSVLHEALDTLPADAPPAMREIVRKMHIQEALGYIQHEAARATKANQPRLARYLNAMDAELRSEPIGMEKLLGDVAGPAAARKVIRGMTDTMYHALLGWNIGAAASNLTQNVLAAPYTGGRSLAKGMLKAMSKEGRAETSFLNLNRRPMDQAQEREFHQWVENYLDVAQTPMRWSDSVNRRVTYLAAKKQAIERYGASEADARAWALDITEQVQGVPGDLGANPLIRSLGPMRALIRYPLLWLSLAEDLARHPDSGVKLRAFGLFSGAAALTYMGGANVLDYLVPRFQTPPAFRAAADAVQHTSDTLLGTALADHEASEHADPASTENSLFPVYPVKVARLAGRMYDHGMEDRDIVNRTGRKARTITAKEDLLGLLSYTPAARAAEREKESEQYGFAATARQEETIASRKTRRQAGEQMAAGNRDAALTTLRDKGFTRAQIKEFLREYDRTPTERARRATPKRRRDEFDRTFGIGEDEPDD